MKGVSILSIRLLLFLSPAHVWKIPCCHSLRQDAPSTNESLAEKMDMDKDGKKRGEDADG